jgi:hypothetical protein
MTSSRHEAAGRLLEIADHTGDVLPLLHLLARQLANPCCAPIKDMATDLKTEMEKLRLMIVKSRPLLDTLMTQTLEGTEPKPCGCGGCQVGD